MHNCARAWNDIPIKTLENSWNQLLKGVTQEDVREWLEEDGGDPGHQLQSDQEIAATSSDIVVPSAGADVTAAKADVKEPDAADAEPRVSYAMLRTLS